MLSPYIFGDYDKLKEMYAVIFYAFQTGINALEKLSCQSGAFIIIKRI